MKIIIIFAICHILIVYNADGQSYPLKETYDQSLEPHYASSEYSTPTNWYSSWNEILLSYLRMYETTLDKAYLIKFIKCSYMFQLGRLGGLEYNDLPIWYIPDDEQLLYGGQLIRPMAEFVHLVRSNQSLYNTNLPTLDGIPTQIGSQNILGYGDYANWLQGRVVETLDYFLTHYWNDDDGYFSKHWESSDNDYTDIAQIAEINFHSALACALFYIGNVDPNGHSNYTTIAEKIVTFFKNRVTEYTGNHSYTWFHKDEPNCTPTTHLPCREDVRHGAWDIQIPIVAYRLYGNGLYSISEMNKFCHTFTYNIWDRYNHVIHNTVFGTDFQFTDDNTYHTDCYGAHHIEYDSPNWTGEGEVLAWMPLQIWDDVNSAPNDIYTVLLTQAIKLVANHSYDPAILPLIYQNGCYHDTYLLSGPVSFRGCSEVVKAQYDHGCVDLTLYNRDVIYDQDFFGKHDLKVTPQKYTTSYDHPNLYPSGSLPFADPQLQIFADGGNMDRFVIEDGVTVNMMASNEIDLLPGFEAKVGSTFNATINTNGCNLWGHSDVAPPHNSGDGPSNLRTTVPPKKNTTKQTAVENSLQVYPNPSNGIITLTINNQTNGTYRFVLTDISGRMITDRNDLINGSNTIDESMLDQGLYIYKVYSSNELIGTGKIAIVKGN